MLDPEKLKVLEPYIDERTIYVLMSAMRGPDIPEFSFLKFITMVLRGMVFDDSTCQGFCTEKFNYREWQTMVYMISTNDKTKEMLGRFPHFLRHLQDAVQMTQDHPIWKEHGKDVLQDLNNLI